MLAVGAVLAACGGPSTAASPTPRATPSATATPVSSASTDPRDAPVINTYLAATRAFVHAELSMDPNDPALVATMTGEELSTVKKNLIIDRAGGLAARGDITPGSPHVVSNDGQTAVVRDCAYSALLLYDQKTGKPASGNVNGPQQVGVTATLTLVDGTWKESLVDGRFGSCPVGY